MTIADRILKLNLGLRPDWKIPEGIEILYPYDNQDTNAAMTQFYQSYYNDQQIRIGLFGINPGRFGAGITGVPFTDPIRLESICDIQNNFKKKPELSSDFVYRVIEKWDTPDQFYNQFLITSLCPLGFTKDGKNYNYYDDKHLQNAVEPYIIQNIETLLDKTITNKIVFSMGMGKNMKYFKKINAQHQFFDKIIALPHPRWVMQYRRKSLDLYISEYEKKLKQNA